MKNQQYVLMDSPHYQMFHGLVQKAIPILLFLDEKQSSHPKLTIPQMPDADIESILEIQPFNFETLVKGPEIMEELERDLMVEKIIMHAVAYYLVGTQLKKMKSDENLIEANIFIRRAWKIGCSFLPTGSKIYNSIGSAWDKCKRFGNNRVRSISRIKPQVKNSKLELRSVSSNKFRPSPCKKMNETNKDPLGKSSEHPLLPLRKKIIGKFRKMK